ncbi:peptide deformylase [Thalassoporum mexicanum PCC 7367]|uniref:peptide deformylase n=1 Tax=Thalassoporum mexicanum TaxID=3457544 RepID=UPI00029F9B00|nr:peptide deformylase [Pseudanabaena sp. PCC 7367]AFY71370.1 peptide deformylase [Pseudanabaena sp. PCC 7367]
MTSTVLQVSKQKLKNPPLQVHKLGDRVLRQPAKRVSKVNTEIRDIAIKMLQTMYSEDGIGLAAPQVGINKQIIVVDCEPDKEDAEPLVLINPEIKAFGNQIELGQEGCLSVPQVFMDVKRPASITVAFKDPEGKPQRLEVDGLLARVIQHEIDHLNGVMFVDHVQNAIALKKELDKHGFSVKDVQPMR